MNIRITSFTNPFSFFCANEDCTDHTIINLIDNSGEASNICTSIKNKYMNAKHGQYVAVMWKNKWVRGVVSMETHFLIWLLDYGIFLRPNENTNFTDLPLEYRTQPTKIFEASIHGVVPFDKVLTEYCQIKNEITTFWTPGSIEKCQSMIKRANKIFFQPVALLTMEHKDLVLGDLFLEIEGKGTVNIIEELERWPVFLERNIEAYIENFPQIYSTRQLHYLNSSKLDLPDLPKISIDINLSIYLSIAKMSNQNLALENECLSTIENFSQVKGKTKSKFHQPMYKNIQTAL